MEGGGRKKEVEGGARAVGGLRLEAGPRKVEEKAVSASDVTRVRVFGL